MKQLKSSLSHLRLLFERAITLRDIAEPLASFDHEQPASKVQAFMQQRGFDVVGIRENGVITGYVVRGELKEGCVGLFQHAFSPGQVKLDSDPLFQAFPALEHSRQVFVNVVGHVGGIITRGDLQKTPVRLWLFGLVSLTEMQLLRVIRDRYPADPWTSLLPPERVAAARKVFEARRSRNEENELSDCLQFCDKAAILAKDEELRPLLGFESKAASDRFFRRIQNLRDALAHSNDFLQGEWSDMVELIRDLEAMLERLEKCVIPAVK